MKKLIYLVAVASLLVAGFASGQTTGPISPWQYGVSPVIRPVNNSSVLQVPSLASAGLCLKTNASGTISTTACGAGGGGGVTTTISGVQGPAFSFLTSGTGLTISTSTGVVTFDWTNPGYITGISSGDVTGALGFTPLDIAGSNNMTANLIVGGIATSTITGDGSQSTIGQNLRIMGNLIDVGTQDSNFEILNDHGYSTAGSISIKSSMPAFNGLSTQLLLESYEDPGMPISQASIGQATQIAAGPRLATLTIFPDGYIMAQRLGDAFRVRNANNDTTTFWVNDTNIGASSLSGTGGILKSSSGGTISVATAGTDYALPKFSYNRFGSGSPDFPNAVPDIAESPIRIHVTSNFANASDLCLASDYTDNIHFSLIGMSPGTADISDDYFYDTSSNYHTGTGEYYVTFSHGVVGGEYSGIEVICGGSPGLLLETSGGTVKFTIATSTVSTWRINIGPLDWDMGSGIQNAYIEGTSTYANANFVKGFGGGTPSDGIWGFVREDTMNNTRITNQWAMTNAPDGSTIQGPSRAGTLALLSDITDLTVNSLVAGSGISLSSATGTVTISATGGGGGATTTITADTLADGPNFTFASSATISVTNSGPTFSWNLLGSYLQSGDNISTLTNDSGYVTSSIVDGYQLSMSPGIGIGINGTTINNNGVTGLAGSGPITVNQATGTVTVGFTNPGYITGNQTITLSGGVSGSGSTAITTTLNPFTVASATITTATATTLYSTNLYLSGLATTFLATDATGKVIATTTPTSGVNYLQLASSVVSPTSTAYKFAIGTSTCDESLCVKGISTSDIFDTYNSSNALTTRVDKNGNFVIGSTSTLISLSNVPFAIDTNKVGYTQAIIRNTNSGATSTIGWQFWNASSTSDVYGEVGMNPPNYSDGSYPAESPNSLYLLNIQNGTNAGGIDLISSSTNGEVKIYTKGTVTSSIRMTVSASGTISMGTSTVGDEVNGLDVNGVVHSLTGGFKFPDNSVMTSAPIITTSSDVYVITIINSSSTASTSSQAITGLSWAIASSTRYDIECKITYNSSAATIGLGVGWSMTQNATYGSGLMTSPIGVATNGSVAVTNAGNSFDNASTNFTSASLGTVGNTAMFYGYLKVGGVNDTLSMKFKPETATNGGTVIASSTFCKYHTY